MLLAAGMFGWAVASVLVIGAHRWALPEPERVRPERCVVIDRTTSNVPLSRGPDTRGGGEGYGLFEQWLARLDSHTVRREGAAAFSGDVLAIICPNRSVSEEFRQKLEQYVNDGGKLLVIDSPANIGSTANSLLWPFGLSIHHDRAWKGRLATAIKLPSVEVAEACEVVGGQPVARLDQFPVAAVVRHGKGSVMAIGFGSLWNDRGLGENWGVEPEADGKPQTPLERAESPGWMLEPDATVKARYDVLFGLLRSFFESRPWPSFPPPTPIKSEPVKESGLKESGPAEL